MKKKNNFLKRKNKDISERDNVKLNICTKRFDDLKIWLGFLFDRAYQIERLIKFSDHSQEANKSGRYYFAF